MCVAPASRAQYAFAMPHPESLLLILELPFELGKTALTGNASQCRNLRRYAREELAEAKIQECGLELTLSKFVQDRRLA